MNDLSWNPADAIRHAARVRARLLNPPKRGKDSGIKLYADPIGPEFVQVEKKDTLTVSPVVMERVEHGASAMEFDVPTGFSDLTPSEILAYVSLETGFRVSDIASQSRVKILVDCRHMATYLMRRYRATSFPEIGRRLGGRDHTTQLYAYRKIEQKVAAGRYKVPEFNPERAMIARRMIGINGRFVSTVNQ